MHKHLTASVFLFSWVRDIPHVALILHQSFGKWMIPGGHVEKYENPAEAAVREVKEETGLIISLFENSIGNLSKSKKRSIGLVPTPLAILEELIPANLDQEEHIHVDCLYLGLLKTQSLNSSEFSAKQLRWIPLTSLHNLDMFEATRSLTPIFFEVWKNIKSDTDI